MIEGVGRDCCARCVMAVGRKLTWFTEMLCCLVLVEAGIGSKTGVLIAAACTSGVMLTGRRVGFGGGDTRCLVVSGGGKGGM